MAHQMVFIEANDREVLFECGICKKRIGFALENLGEPNAVYIENNWQPHLDYAMWLGECDV